MGQSTASVPKAVSGTSHKATVDQSEPLKISVLSTEIGWCGLLGRAETVDRLLIGHHSAADVHQAVKALNLADQVNSGEEIEQENWFPELHERLQDYFQGALVEFQDQGLLQTQARAAVGMWHKPARRIGLPTCRLRFPI